MALDLRTERDRCAHRLDQGKESLAPRTTTQDQTTDEAMETAAVVIPTLNEERSIGKVIDYIRCQSPKERAQKGRVRNRRAIH